MALVALTAAGCRFGPDVRGPFRGQIVDAETGAPMANVNVVAAWPYVGGLFSGAATVYETRETVSDANGRFEVRELRGVILEPSVDPPHIYVFHAGYAAEPANGLRNRPVVPLRRLTTRSELCGGDRLNLPFLVPQDRMPRYTAAVHAERDALKCGAPGEN